MEIIGQGTFFEPGIYVSVYDSIGSPLYTESWTMLMRRRIASKLNEEDRVAMKEWLVAAGFLKARSIRGHAENSLNQWVNNYDLPRAYSG